MTLSLKEIRSKFDRNFVQISYEGWVELDGYVIGMLFEDFHTKKIYLKTNRNPSQLKYNKPAGAYRLKFLSRFRYTHRLSYASLYPNNRSYIVELHGFRKDM